MKSTNRASRWSVSNKTRASLLVGLDGARLTTVGGPATGCSTAAPGGAATSGTCRRLARISLICLAASLSARTAKKALMASQIRISPPCRFKGSNRSQRAQCHSPEHFPEVTPQRAPMVLRSKHCVFRWGLSAIVPIRPVPRGPERLTRDTGPKRPASAQANIPAVPQTPRLAPR